MERSQYFVENKIFRTPILQTSAVIVNNFFGFNCANGEFLVKLNCFVESWKHANICQYSVDEEDIVSDRWNPVVLMRTLAFQMVLKAADDRVEIDPYILACGAELCAERLCATHVDDSGDLETLTDYTNGFHGKCRTAMPRRCNMPWVGLPERLNPVKRVFSETEGNKNQHFMSVLRKKVLIPPVDGCIFCHGKLQFIQADVQLLWSSFSKVEEATVLLFCCENCERIRAMCTRPCERGKCACRPLLYYYLDRVGNEI